MVYTDFRVYATSDEDMKQLLTFFAVVQHCGHVGHCANLKVVVDGDGSGRFRFQMKEGEQYIQLPDNDKWDEKDALWLGE